MGKKIDYENPDKNKILAIDIAFLNDTFLPSIKEVSLKTIAAYFNDSFIIHIKTNKESKTLIVKIREHKNV